MTTTTQKTTLKTTIHFYRFDISDPEQKTEYEKMVDRIKSNQPTARGKWMKSFSLDGSGHCFGEAGTSEEIEIETAHIFDNQWNSTTYRVFDWAEDAIFVNGRENKKIKKGHWLEITEDMTNARITTHKCGYCGAQFGPLHKPVPDSMFCDCCLDSPYLKETELHLLRLLPLAGESKREPLTQLELDEILPVYIDRQTIGANSRAVQKREKQREKILSDYEKSVENASDKKEGLLWLLDRNFDIDNVIYYNHTQQFCFGWRSPLSESVKSKLLDIISEFPFDYEIKSV